MDFLYLLAWQDIAQRRSDNAGINPLQRMPQGGMSNMGIDQRWLSNGTSGTDRHFVY